MPCLILRTTPPNSRGVGEASLVAMVARSISALTSALFVNGRSDARHRLRIRVGHRGSLGSSYGNYSCALVKPSRCCGFLLTNDNYRAVLVAHPVPVLRTVSAPWAF